jgi:AraC family transcriptional regulator
MAASCHIEKTVALAGIGVDLVAFRWDEPLDAIYHAPEAGMLDMCLTPRPDGARGRYEGSAPPGRFQPLGEIIFVPPDTRLHSQAAGGRQRSLRIKLERALLQPGSRGHAQPRPAGPTLSDVSIRNACWRIVRELDEPGFASTTVIEAMARVITVDLRRHAFSSAVPDNSRQGGGLAAWRMRLIEERIHRAGASPDLGELAALCRLSRRHLTRGFRQETGQSIVEFIAAARLERAKYSLANSTLPMKALASDLGFAHCSTFSSAFRTSTGMSPSEYRQRFGTCAETGRLRMDSVAMP